MSYNEGTGQKVIDFLRFRVVIMLLVAFWVGNAALNKLGDRAVQHNNIGRDINRHQIGPPIEYTYFTEFHGIPVTFDNVGVSSMVVLMHWFLFIGFFQKPKSKKLTKDELERRKAYWSSSNAPGRMHELSAEVDMTPKYTKFATMIKEVY